MCKVVTHEKNYATKCAFGGECLVSETLFGKVFLKRV